MSRSTREVEVYRESEASPPRNRWDRERFDFYRTQPTARERDIDIRISEQRGSPAPAPLVASPPPPPESDRRTVVEEKDRFVERDHGRYVERDHDRFVERDRYRPERRYWEEPTPSEVARGALAPYRKVVEYEMAPAPAARPRMLRRQSSLDTFDRRPSRYERDEWRPPSYVPYALPYRGRGYDPYYDDDFRYRERESEHGWEEEYRDVRVRRKSKGGGRRRRKHSHRERSLSVSSSSSSSSSSATKSVATAKSSKTTMTISKTLLGKKGKTRMPKRLVHKQAIMDLGLPYDEEEHFIIVQRALEKDHIDDVIKRSEGYKDTKVTYKFEEVTTGGDGGGGGGGSAVEEEISEEKIETRSTRTISPSRASSIVAPPPPPPVIIEIPPPPASVAPSSAHTHRSHRSRSRANSVREDFFERKEVVEGGGSVAGMDRRSSRSIRDEIRALEAERESLRLERRADRRLLEAERRDDRDELVFVEKDRKGRKNPDPKAVAFALSTLT